MSNPDPNSFSFRLRGTIAKLEVETQQGVEDWSPTITRLREVLAEEEQAELVAVAAANELILDMDEDDDDAL